MATATPTSLSAWMSVPPAIALFRGQPLLGRTVDLELQATLRITGASLAAQASGVGDVDGDGYGDFVVVDGGTVYCFAGGPNLTDRYGAEITLDEATATYAGSGVLAVGDTDGDGRADFITIEGLLILGNGSTQDFTGYTSVLAAPGDVNGDGLADVLLGKTGQQADLILGGAFTVQATLSRVAGAASAPAATLSAAADFNRDGSDDLLVIPAPGAGSPPVVGESVTLTSTVTVYADVADCALCLPGDWGSTVFTGIQAAIDSGAQRVQLQPGQYAQTFTLASHVYVLGAGAETTWIVAPPGATPGAPLVSAVGVTDARLARVTLAGDGAVNGFSAAGGAQDIRLDRLIVRDTATALHLDGSATQVEIVNNTLVNNANGLVAANCAGVDVRNTIFAFHSGTALSAASCATTRLHTYNAYWANTQDLRVDGAPSSDVGLGEIFRNPQFTAPGQHDYRPQAGAPVLDAGNPSDPVLPGSGSRVDIGYVEVGGASLYVDDDYCAVCLNDGLQWQVEAFATIQGALDVAAARLRAAQTPAGSLTIGVAAGVYTENIVISSHIRLLGSGAAGTTISGGAGAPTVLIAGTTGVEVEGFRITGGAPAQAAVSVTAAGNVALTRNLIEGAAGSGISLAEMAFANIQFNTIISNTQDGIRAADARTWAEVHNNIIAHNGAVGVAASDGGMLVSNYNLVYGNSGGDYAGRAAGPDDLSAPAAFADAAYTLRPDSPAVDAADPLTSAPVGGGARADIGYAELLATPLSLLFGREDVSLALGAAGVVTVETGLAYVGDPTQPLTATLPGTFTPATLATPSTMFAPHPASYWQTLATPQNGDGLYRFYSRAGDLVGNGMTDQLSWFRGAFVVDSAAPVVTWLSPADGATVLAPLALEASVADYVAGDFSIAEFFFEVDGARVPATWSPAPWSADPATQAAREMWGWHAVAAGTHTVQAVARDHAGNEGRSASITLHVSGNRPADLTPPTLTLATPTEHAWLAGTVTLSGTVSDNGDGVAAVEVSVDGGLTWSSASVEDDTWRFVWPTPEDDAVNYPLHVHAWDRSGNTTTLPARVVTVDNVPPTLSPTANLTVGQRLREATPLVIRWPAPERTETVVRAAVDQTPVATATVAAPGTAYTATLDGDGEWYAHLNVTDFSVGVLDVHLGPWLAGICQAGDWTQPISVDGEIDRAADEWRRDFEYLDSDERADEAQALYAAWDPSYLYLAWEGVLASDTTRVVYLDWTTGGTTAPVTGALTTLPFMADVALVLTEEVSATVWAFTEGAWQLAAAPDGFAVARGLHQTELRLPWEGGAYPATLHLLAVAVSDEGHVSSLFPTTNLAAAFGAPPAAWQAAYVWNNAALNNCATIPQAGQPTAPQVELTVSSAHDAARPLGVQSSVSYTIALENREAAPATGLQLALDATGLTYQAGCALCSPGATHWEVDLPDLPGYGTYQVVITGTLDADLGTLTAVTSTVALKPSSAPGAAPIAQERYSHGVDTIAPTVWLESTGIAPYPRVSALLGQASDTAAHTTGSGVAQVQVRLDGGAWQTAAGTERWVYTTTMAEGAESVQVYVRATDNYGNTGETGPFTVLVDHVAPTAWIEAATVITRSGRLDGLSNDPAPRSLVGAVYVKIDDGPWGRAATLSPILDADANQPWTHIWSPTQPQDGITHTVWVSATDRVGNTGAVGGPYTVTVDNAAPQVTMGRVENDVVNTANLRLMDGSVSDGAGIRSATARVILPTGGEITTSLQLDGAVWRYVQPTPFPQTGDLVVFLNFSDHFGNVAAFGPYPVRVNPDVAISQTVTPAVVNPGDTLTTTLVFTSFDRTTDVVITYAVAAALEDVQVVGSSGAPLIQIGGAPNFAWSAGTLYHLEGGVITLTGVVNAGLTGSQLLFSPATITTTAQDGDPHDNQAWTPARVRGVHYVDHERSDGLVAHWPFDAQWDYNDASIHRYIPSYASVGFTTTVSEPVDLPQWGCATVCGGQRHRQNSGRRHHGRHPRTAHDFAVVPGG